ncbi:hypothetical protein C5167_046159 [Papaver somniferum]|uniref:Uncharacterized protein n=1 Tax=Papaver somniferum TaxID=3469 RepID=A0A4Y7LD01_PAPSO|nr:hypothetical protein C5167_046159 [Papaver somniferum]
MSTWKSLTLKMLTTLAMSRSLDFGIFIKINISKDWMQEKLVHLKKDNVENQVETLTWHLQLMALGMFKVLRVKCYY